MITGQFSRLCLILVAISCLGACKNGLVYNNETSGPVFVKAQDAIEEPTQDSAQGRSTRAIPNPFPVIKRTVPLSVAEQNEKAISVFSDKGFEAVESEKGVVVYLPPTIYFKDSESSITLDARSKIAEIAQELVQPYLADRDIEVSGHTDTLGNDSINMALSKQRALAATAELVFSKVPKSRLSSVWYGETRLRVPDYHQDGTLNLESRNLNRRVEFTILNPK